MLDKQVMGRKEYTQVIHQLREALDTLQWLDTVGGVSDDEGFVPNVHIQVQNSRIEELHTMITDIRNGLGG